MERDRFMDGILRKLDVIANMWLLGLIEVIPYARPLSREMGMGVIIRRRWTGQSASPLW